jgi:hypothetical protein
MARHFVRRCALSQRPVAPRARRITALVPVLEARAADLLTSDLAGALVAALDERSRPGPPSFWWEAVAWFSRQQGFDTSEVGPLAGYLAHAVSEDEDYSLAGRTLVSVRRAMVAWHAELAQIRRLEGVRFERRAPTSPPAAGRAASAWARPCRRRSGPWTRSSAAANWCARVR